MDDLAAGERRLDRRKLLLGGAGAVTWVGLASALGWPETARAGASPLPLPNPIPGGSDLSGFGLSPPFDFIHVFTPGDPAVNAALPFSGIPLEGLDREPATITDFNGTTALPYLAGTATGSDGTTYGLEVDVRAMEGLYVADGSTSRGLFALI